MNETFPGGNNESDTNEGADVQPSETDVTSEQSPDQNSPETSEPSSEASQELLEKYRETLTGQEQINFDAMIKLKSEYPDGLIIRVGENGVPVGKIAEVPIVKHALYNQAYDQKSVILGKPMFFDSFGRKVNDRAKNYQGSGRLGYIKFGTISEKGFSEYCTEPGIGTGLSPERKEILYVGSAVIEEIDKVNSEGKVTESYAVASDPNFDRKVEIPLLHRTQINEEMPKAIRESMLTDLADADRTMKERKAAA